MKRKKSFVFRDNGAEQSKLEAMVDLVYILKLNRNLLKVCHMFYGWTLFLMSAIYSWLEGVL